MSEEKPEVIHEPEEVVVSEDTQILEKAVSLGFKPSREDFKGEHEDYIDSPKEYLKRKEVKDHISRLHKKTKEQQAVIDTLSLHVSQLRDAGYKKDVADLQAQHIQAVRSGDVQAAVKVTEELATLKKDPPKVGVHPAIKRFGEENGSWFNKTTPENAAMFSYTETAYNNYRASHGGETPDNIEDAIEHALASVKEQFPSKFGGLHRGHLSGHPAPKESDNITYKGESKLPKEIRDVIRTLIGTKVKPGISPNFNVENFLEQCRKRGAL